MSDEPTALSTLHNLLHSLRTTYASASSSSPTQQSSAPNPAILHPFHPSPNGYSILPPPNQTPLEKGKGKEREQKSELEKEVIIKELREMKQALSYLRESWKTDKDTSDARDEGVGGSITGGSTSIITSERKKNGLIRIMADYCASSSALLQQHSIISSLLQSGAQSTSYTSNHHSFNGLADGKKVAVPFIKPSTTTSPLHRLLETSSQYAKQYEMDTMTDTRNPDFGMDFGGLNSGMGGNEDGSGGSGGGDGKGEGEGVSSSLFAGKWTVLDVEIGTGDEKGAEKGRNGGEARRGGKQYFLEKMVLDLQDPFKEDGGSRVLPFEQSILRRKFQTYLSFLNDHNRSFSSMAEGDGGLDSFSDSDDHDKQDQETFALRAERVYLDFEQEWLDVWAIDKRMRELQLGIEEKRGSHTPKENGMVEGDGAGDAEQGEGKMIDLFKECEGVRGILDELASKG